MAKQDILLVNTSDTFQLWLNKTNELVELMNSEVLTASPIGDITEGNATLIGTFTTTNLISNNTVTTSNLSTTSVVNNLDPANFVAFNSPISVTSTQEKLLNLRSSSLKPAINLINAENANWNVTLDTITSTSPFVIKTEGATTPQFLLTQSGDLTIDGSLIVGEIVGNTATATKLFTPRNINGVAFDGSQAITITANTTNTLTRGAYLTGGTVSTFNGSVAQTWSVDAASANTASKVVARDASGNFSAGTITAALTGNASSANTLVNLTASVTELNYVAGVTSSIQEQLNAKGRGGYEVPAGGIILWSGASTAIPVGWLLCDGESGTPDLRNRFVVGAGATYAVNNTGGQDSVTLSTANLPSHSHTVNIDSGTNSIGHTHGGTVNASTGLTGSVSGISQSFSTGEGTATGVFSKISANADGTPTAVDRGAVGGFNFAGNHSHTFTGGAESVTHTHNVNGPTGSTGSGSSFDNRPRYYALCYIMKS